MALLELDAFIPYRLSVTSNLVSDAIARTYEALFGLTIPEWRLVAVVAEGERVTQQAIGSRTRMDKVTVSRAAIALVGRDLLARTPNASDRRSHLLSLTQQGETLYAAVAPKAIEIEQRLFSRFTPAELETFTAMLRRIDAAVQEEA
jgi:DNA-binding MarR family transcriptional regulator